MWKSPLGLNVAQSTLLLMAGGVVVLLMLVVATFRLATQTTSGAEQIAAERQVRMAARVSLTGLLYAETGQRGFLLTGDETYLESYSEGIDVATKGVAQLKTAMKGKTTVVAPAFENIDRLVGDKFAELAKTIALARAGQQEAAIAVVKSNEGKVSMDQLRDIFQDITKQSDERIGANLGDLTAATERLTLTTSLGSTLLIGFAALAFYIVAKNTDELLGAQKSLLELTNELEERVADRTVALSQANEEIQRFAYIVSHDLRAPLVNIMGFTSELDTAANSLQAFFAENPSEAAQRTGVSEIAANDIPECVRFIRSSSTKMDGLIGAILRLSREGRRELKRERVLLSELVDASLASLQHQIDAAGAVVEVAHPLPSIVSDRLALEQIFGNLIDNAVKYLAPDRPGRITITSEESGGRAKIRVADNGRGIDKNDQARIFELFRRAGAQDRPGDGIGLAHVRSLVRLIGGDVTVDSTLGQGTTFVVDLPKKMILRTHKEQA